MLSYSNNGDHAQHHRINIGMLNFSLSPFTKCLVWLQTDRAARVAELLDLLIWGEAVDRSKQSVWEECAVNREWSVLYGAASIQWRYRVQQEIQQLTCERVHLHIFKQSRSAPLYLISNNYHTFMLTLNYPISKWTFKLSMWKLKNIHTAISFAHKIILV